MKESKLKVQIDEEWIEKGEWVRLNKRETQRKLFFHETFEYKKKFERKLEVQAKTWAKWFNVKWIQNKNAFDA